MPWKETCVTCQSEFECSREEYIGGYADIYRGECVSCRAPLCIQCNGTCPSCGRPLCDTCGSKHPFLPQQAPWCRECLAEDESLKGDAA